MNATIEERLCQGVIGELLGLIFDATMFCSSCIKEIVRSSTLLTNSLVGERN